MVRTARLEGKITSERVILDDLLGSLKNPLYPGEKIKK